LSRRRFFPKPPAIRSSLIYYYAQAAWEFAHGNNSSAQKWIAAARKILTPPLLAWFARPLYDLGSQKDKPPAVLLGPTQVRSVDG
jgi:hypothetical protein